jgi:glucosyl-3-phosphoglycerate synthase
MDCRGELHTEMIQYNLVRTEYQPDIFRIEGLERPPMIQIPEYRAKFNRGAA